jgi:hypothetical protein
MSVLDSTHGWILPSHMHEVAALNPRTMAFESHHDGILQDHQTEGDDMRAP